MDLFQVYTVQVEMLTCERVSGVHGAGRDELTEPVPTVHPRCRVRDERVSPTAPETASKLPALQEELRNSVVGLQGKSRMSQSGLDVISDFSTFPLSPHLSPSPDPCQLIFHKLSAIKECQYCQLSFSCAVKNELDQ